MFNAIHGQEFINQIRTYIKYTNANKESDVISLLVTIHKIYYKHDHKMYKSQTIVFSLKGLINCKHHNISNINCWEKMRD